MYMLKNYMEDIVENILKRIMNDYGDFCKCQKCIFDIKAIALNNLPTKYIVTQIGEVYVKADAMDKQLQIDVTNQVLNAIRIVSKNPHDTREE